MTETHRPAEPVEEGKKKHVGFAAVAERLNKLNPNRKRPISRQLVYKWYIHRSYNGFPAPISPAKGGNGRPEFDLKAVEKWYATYRPQHGGTAPESTTESQVSEPRRITSSVEDKPLAA